MQHINIPYELLFKYCIDRNYGKYYRVEYIDNIESAILIENVFNYMQYMVGKNVKLKQKL